MDDNPHCSLYALLHPTLPSSPQNAPPALTLLFSFKPKSGYDLTLTNHYERETNTFHCKKNQLIDQASKKCIDFSDTIPRIYKPTKKLAMMLPNPSINLSSSHEANVRHFLTQNCSKVIFDISHVVFYSNLSIFVPSTGQILSNGSYIKLHSSVVVCLQKNTDRIRIQLPYSSFNLDSISDLQILTYTGYALSFLSELILLVIYSLLKDLRNRPGKILMSLTSCLIVYQVLFLLAMFNDVHWICVSIAALLHYFLLTCFAWMSVMAFDVMKTFAMKSRFCYLI
jgi:hypothetical protein